MHSRPPARPPARQLTPQAGDDKENQIVGPQLAGGIRPLRALTLAVSLAPLVPGREPGAAGVPAGSIPALEVLSLAPAPRATSDLWLSEISTRVERARIPAGGELGVRGVLPTGRPGVRVTLQFRSPWDEHWRSVAWNRSGKAGHFGLAAPATRSGQVRVVVAGSDGDRRAGLGSATHRVVVDAVLNGGGVPSNILWDRPALVRGHLEGAGPGRRVVLQRHNGTGWRTVATTRTAGSGGFRLRYMAVRPGALRLRFPGDRDLGAVARVIRFAGDSPVAGGFGRLRIANGANAPGRPISAAMDRFAHLMAGVYGAPLVVSIGTNHSPWTVNGTVSDHWSGNAVDFGMPDNRGTADGPVGDRIAAAALVVAGVAPAEALARARAGGLMNVVVDGMRVQVLWKTYMGGNHHGHVHVGLHPVT
jgi:hypothetical protein